MAQQTDHIGDTNKMVTAVEWLVEQLARKNNEFQALTFYYDHKEEIQQAKQMEKEQIKIAFEFVVADAYNYNDDEGEEYYNETYQTKSEVK